MRRARTFVAIDECLGLLEPLVELLEPAAKEEARLYISTARALI